MPNEHSNTPSPGQRPQTIPLSQIHDLPGVFNPKPVESKLGSMILSIQNNGVMEPVILRDRGDGQYMGWEFDGGRVEANADKNRLQVFFDEIPPEEIRKELKGRGFKWARSEGAWQRQLSDNAIYAASRIEAIKPADGSDPTKIQPKRKAHTGPTR